MIFIKNAICVLCCDVLVYHFALNISVIYSCFLMCKCFVLWGGEMNVRICAVWCSYGAMCLRVCVYYVRVCMCLIKKRKLW